MNDEHRVSDDLAETEHEITITAKLPRRDKTADFKFKVSARSNAEALVKGEEVWRQACEPQDIRVQKVKPQ